MNSKLYDRKAKLPKSLIDHLSKSFEMVEADSNVEGFNRNQDLRGSGIITYQQLKRVKNWFDGFDGNKEDAPFVLNGGDRMNKWCDHVLNHWRTVEKDGKGRKEAAGMENQFIDDHDKDGIVVNPHDRHEKGINKFNTSVSESVETFKRLIDYGSTER